MKLLKKNIWAETFFIILLVSLNGCSRKNPVEKTVSQNMGPVSDNMIWNMEVNITNENELKANFFGGYVERDNVANSRYSENRIDSGLRIDFYEKGLRSGRLTSDRGNINDLTELFSAWDNVIFSSEKGYVLYTDTLIWNRKEARIYSDSDVMMIRDGRDTLYGEGFVTDDSFGSYEIKKPRGRAVIENKENN